MVDSNQFAERIRAGSMQTPIIEHKRRFTPNLTRASMSTEEIERISNMYDIFDETEVQRIGFQRNLFRISDIKHLSEATHGKNECALLDVGTNTGELIQDRVRSIGNISYVLGIDCNEEVIRRNLVRDDGGVIDYAVIDCESDDFVDTIIDLYGGSLVRFDLIFCSMLLLHTKNPFKVLQNLRSVLNPGGQILIRDMDDGLTIAYPDPEGIVPRMLDISNRVPYTGYRHCGRELPSLLLKAGYTDIRYEIENVTTVGLNYQGITHLFNINFNYLPGDLKLAYDDDNAKYQADYDWMQEAYPKLEELFHTAGFFYNMGNVFITATIA